MVWVTQAMIADRVRALPFPNIRRVIGHVIQRVARDRISLIAAGTTFYLLLALFPALTAFVSLYGLFADPRSIGTLIASFQGVLPAGGTEVIAAELDSLVGADNGTLSFSFFFGVVVALWSANNGVKTLFEATNVAYGVHEGRNFFRRNFMALLATLGVMVVAALSIVAVGVVPTVLSYVGLDGAAGGLLATLRWPVFLVVAGLATNLLYRYGPSRPLMRWRWVSWGIAFAAIGWLAVSLGFSWYLSNFANYDATYGALGAVIGLLTWTWLSVLILLAGAELDAELERLAAGDTAPPAPVPPDAPPLTQPDASAAA